MTASCKLGRMGACNPCGAPPPPPFTSCCPCGIPQENMTFSWDGPLAGSTTLTWNSGPGNWTASCQTLAGPLYFSVILDCFVAGANVTTRLRITSFSGAACTGTPTLCSTSSDLANWTCTPFNMAFKINNGACPLLFGLGFRTFTVTDSNSAQVCNCDTVLKNRTIFVTDAANTAIPVGYSGTSQWGTTFLSIPASPVTTGIGGSQVCSSTTISGNTSYRYVINCTNLPGSTQINLAFRRLWSSCSCPLGPAIQYNVFGNGLNCPPLGTGAFGGESDGNGVISGIPFSGSIGSLTSVGSGLPDPVGGGLTFSS